MELQKLIDYLENIVPKSMQESYDNCGLIVGNVKQEISGVLIALDCLESVIDEAIEKKCNVVLTHHPIVFKGLKSLTGKNYVERTILKAIKNDIALYAIHTNIDNYIFGVNHKIGEKLGLENLKILAPKENNLQKLSFFVPENHAEFVLKSLCESGAGQIGNYDNCSFKSWGEGTFRALKGAQPFVGKQGEIHKEKEVKVEVLVTKHNAQKMVAKLVEIHPYEEVAFDLYALENLNLYEGSGMIGDLRTELDEMTFLKQVKSTFKCGTIRHTLLTGKKIKKVAFCGGSGFFLLQHAKKAKADIYITSDIKYHEFFDAENQILLADIGHFESEQFTIDLLNELLIKKFTTFAVHLTEINTNPIKYL